MPTETTMISPYAAMTVNERLFAAGLLSEFDAAARARDRAGMIAILQAVDMGEQAASTADAVLADPGRYGY
jgi:hypothetical protein